MTVYVAHAPGAAALAAKIARAFEREGIFVESEDASRGFTPLRGRDVVALIWSEEMRGEPAAAALLDRALEAWTTDRLVIAAIGGEPVPTQFSDQPVIDASADEAGRRVAEAAARKVETVTALAEPKRSRATEPARQSKGVAFYALSAILAIGALAAASVHAWVGSPEALFAAMGAGLAMAIAAGAGLAAERRARPPEQPPASTFAVIGRVDLQADLMEALRASGATAFDPEAERGGMARADGLVVAFAGDSAGFAQPPAQRALRLARAAGKPIAVLRAGSPDTVSALPAMLRDAPNAAWPGDPRAAAALARALIDQASGAPP
jgi:hypothetical protein